MSLVVLALAVLVQPFQEPVRVEARIEQVTVFGGSAVVQRRAQVAEGTRSVLVADLPWAAEPESVRVRCEGAEVIGVETRARRRPAVAGERIESLRGLVREAEAERAALLDDSAVKQALHEHVLRLLDIDLEAHTGELKTGRLDTGTALANLRFLEQQLGDAKRSLRELAAATAALDTRIADLRRELGAGAEGAGVDVYDVRIDLAPLAAGAIALELEYRVSGAGWRPQYDLRAAVDARRVTLVHRAEVWQTTGEDWSAVTLDLSTARPDLGAQGPEPEAAWLSLLEPSGRGSLSRLRGLGYSADGLTVTPASETLFDDIAFESSEALRASVDSQGLSVRYRVARSETIESRDEPSIVWIGEDELDCTPEYHAVPALDTNVWLRARAVNTSPWTLLPGRASVYFGADFLGHSEVELVPPGGELTLHLGPDPALSLERVQTEDLTKKPGLFGSKISVIEGWRVRIENRGAAVTGRDGSAAVIVREVLPRPRDDRIEVELASAAPKPSEAERWKREREEEGVLTWILGVPQGGAAEIVWKSKIQYPEGRILVR